jgi:hypothetical protein
MSGTNIIRQTIVQVTSLIGQIDELLAQVESDLFAQSISPSTKTSKLASRMFNELIIPSSFLALALNNSSSPHRIRINQSDFVTSVGTIKFIGTTQLYLLYQTFLVNNSISLARLISTEDSEIYLPDHSPNIIKTITKMKVHFANVRNVVLGEYRNTTSTELLKVNELLDVHAPKPEKDQILVYNGINWASQTPQTKLTYFQTVSTDHVLLSATSQYTVLSEMELQLSNGIYLVTFSSSGEVTGIAGAKPLFEYVLFNGNERLPDSSRGFKGAVGTIHTLYTQAIVTVGFATSMVSVQAKSTGGGVRLRERSLVAIKLMDSLSGPFVYSY